MMRRTMMMMSWSTMKSQIWSQAWIKNLQSARCLIVKGHLKWWIRLMTMATMPDELIPGAGLNFRERSQNRKEQALRYWISTIWVFHFRPRLHWTWAMQSRIFNPPRSLQWEMIRRMIRKRSQRAITYCHIFWVIMIYILPVLKSSLKSKLE